MLGGQQWIADVVAPPSFAVWPTGDAACQQSTAQYTVSTPVWIIGSSNGASLELDPFSYPGDVFGVVAAAIQLW